MLDINSLISFINDLKHADTLYLQRYNRQYQLSSIEEEYRVLSLSLYFYLGLLNVIVLLVVVDEKGKFIAIDTFFVGIECYVYALPGFWFYLPFLVLNLKT